MRLPRTAHTEQPWRIHEFTRDFRVEDVWSFRTPGAGPDDLPMMLAAMRGGGSAKQSPVVRFLFAVRWKLGALLGWDKPKTGLESRVQSLRDRVPSELRETVDSTEAAGPFTPVYQLPNESAAEIANKTMHGVMHFGWVPASDGTGDYELRMAVLVKPNGWWGRVYMELIAPFRYLIVYPVGAGVAEPRPRPRERAAGGALSATRRPPPVAQSSAANMPTS